jgi:hypothetical protein
MNRFLRVASGLSVLILTALFGWSLSVNLMYGDRPLAGYRGLLHVLAGVLLLCSLCGAYFLIRGATNSK